MYVCHVYVCMYVCMYRRVDESRHTGEGLLDEAIVHRCGRRQTWIWISAGFTWNRRGTEQRRLSVEWSRRGPPLGACGEFS